MSSVLYDHHAASLQQVAKSTCTYLGFFLEILVILQPPSPAGHYGNGFTLSNMNRSDDMVQTGNRQPMLIAYVGSIQGRNPMVLLYRLKNSN